MVPARVHAGLGMTTSIAQGVAARIAELPDAPPREAAATIEALLIDVGGLCVAARNTEYVRATLAAADEAGPCTVLGHADARSAATAMLVNGTAAHGEDFDDTYEGGPVHAGAVIVPALVATAERHGLAGADLARGIAVGCEVMCRLCAVAPQRVHQAGFHPTAVFGAVGAAAGVGAALRLDADQLGNALGIGGSMASGIIEYLAEGAWTKRMHPGWAAQSGYRAARLAQEGFVGPRTVFEGEHGLFVAFAHERNGDFAAMLADFPSVWRFAGIAFKPYACGTMAHPYIDCARRLVAEGLDPRAIASVECRTAQGIVHRLWEPLAAKAEPPNGYAAKFSIPYGVAVGFLRGDAGLSEYDDVVVRDPAVRALARKVRYVVDPDDPYPRRFTGHVRVRLQDGTIREARQDHFRGGVEAPLTREALIAKFRANCAFGGLTPDAADAWLARLTALPNLRVIEAGALQKGTK
jgi:2-methylcitrate dehydratase PrpD